MKITIEYDDITSSVEFGEFDVNEFTDRLRGLLHTIWLPCQVDEIIPNDEAFDDKEVVNGFNEFDEGRKKGYKEGYNDGCKEALAFRGKDKHHDDGLDALTEKVQKAGYYTDSEQRENAKLLKDKERLDWIFRNCCVEFDGFYKDSFSNRKEVDEAMQSEEDAQ